MPQPEAQSHRTSAVDASRRGAKTLTWILLAVFATGFGLRLAPVLGADTRILQVFPSEDGYLMLTIARNMAIGDGMSVSEGTVPTNGTQPLTTFEWALCFWLSDGDKALGVRYTLYLQLATSVLAALLMLLLGRRLLRDIPHGHTIAAVATAAWYASPLSIPHSMNCLESGNYAAVTLAVFLVIASSASPGASRWSWAKTVGTGVLLGAAFLIRNDAVFLIAAACIAHLTLCGERGLRGMRARLPQTLVMGTISIAVAMPWLVYNKTQFGSIMPISGQAESFAATFGNNIGLVASMLAEYVAVVVQIPNKLQGTLMVELASLGGLIVFALLLRKSFQQSSHEARAAVLMLAIFGLSLAAFYGLYFGAPHFVSRYFFPLSPVLAILTTRELFALYARHRASGGWRVAALRLGVPAAAALLIIGLNVRQYLRMQRHLHFQCVEWVADNVAPDTWIGAVQTGTIGFFHDRTINLDGKVNPFALQHQLSRTVPSYVVEETDITYIVDWFGLAGTWIEMPPLDTQFEIIVADKDANLSVMRRKG